MHPSDPHKWRQHPVIGKRELRIELRLMLPIEFGVGVMPEARKTVE